MTLIAAGLTVALIAVEVLRRRQVRDLTRANDYLRGRHRQCVQLLADRMSR